MAIYTKTGDKGQTKVFDKKTKELISVRKDSCKIKSIGAIDELNSFLGVAKSFSNDLKLQKHIEIVQTNLFVINSILAGGKIRFGKSETKKMEKEIDVWEGDLPVQKHFIFYGGSQVSSLIFYARALARRAERSLVSMRNSSFMIPDSIMVYMNRLSDYLFMLARNINFESKIEEKFWKTSKQSSLRKFLI